jgi:hypothetical protein
MHGRLDIAIFSLSVQVFSNKYMKAFEEMYIGGKLTVTVMHIL